MTVEALNNGHPVNRLCAAADCTMTLSDDTDTIARGSLHNVRVCARARMRDIGYSVIDVNISGKG